MGCFPPARNCPTLVRFGGDRGIGKPGRADFSERNSDMTIEQPDYEAFHIGIRNGLLVVAPFWIIVIVAVLLAVKW